MIEEYLDGKTVFVLKAHEMVCLRALCQDAISRLNCEPFAPWPIELSELRRARGFARQLLEATDPWFEGEDWKLSGVERKDIEEVWQDIGEALFRTVGPVAIGFKPD